MSQQFKVAFELEAGQSNYGRLDIELQSPKGNPAIRISLMPDGYWRMKAGARLSGSRKYEAGVRYTCEVFVYQDRRTYDVYLDGTKISTGIFFARVPSFSRVVFRTGQPRWLPNAESRQTVYRSGKIWGY
jgi:hypothetical protein